jgi:hypothetical protein
MADTSRHTPTIDGATMQVRRRIYALASTAKTCMWYLMETTPISHKSQLSGLFHQPSPSSCDAHARGSSKNYDSPAPRIFAQPRSIAS